MAEQDVVGFAARNNGERVCAFKNGAGRDGEVRNALGIGNVEVVEGLAVKFDLPFVNGVLLFNLESPFLGIGFGFETSIEGRGARVAGGVREMMKRFSGQ